MVGDEVDAEPAEWPTVLMRIVLLPALEPLSGLLTVSAERIAEVEAHAPPPGSAGPEQAGWCR